MINIASWITMSRILLTPVVIKFLLQQQWGIAFLVFVVAASTDLLDGFVARRFQLQTQLGKLLDPVADKCLLMGTMYTLLMMVTISPWHSMAVYFLLAKEMALLSVGSFLVYRYKFFIEPSRLSRIVCIAEIVLVLGMLGCLVWLGSVPFRLLSTLLVVNVVLSLWLLVRYAIMIYKQKLIK